ncbi:MAG: amidohydrolase family protein [Alphaproteobacteria bacterium]|nr:amidohydrolase family protein [Alphaproteobacteria bacterium]
MAAFPRIAACPFQRDRPAGFLLAIDTIADFRLLIYQPDGKTANGNRSTTGAGRKAKAALAASFLNPASDATRGADATQGGTIVEPALSPFGRIIDCDSHYTEPPDLWSRRAPASLRSRVPNVVSRDGYNVWVIEGDRPIGYVGSSVISTGGAKIRGKLSLNRYDEIDSSSYDTRSRVALLDRLGISAQIVYPNVAGFGSARFLGIDDPELKLACVRIYNDAMGELQSESDDRLFPQAILPLWDMKETLKEMRRIHEDLKLRGLTIPDMPKSLGLPDYTDAAWDPFWELASALDLPLNFHIGSSDVELFSSAPWEGQGPERRVAVGAALMYMNNARVLTNLLYADIIERFPQLRFVSVESGVGWIPFMLEAAEYQWDEMCPTEVRNTGCAPPRSSGIRSMPASGSSGTDQDSLSNGSARTTSCSKPISRTLPVSILTFSPICIHPWPNSNPRHAGRSFRRTRRVSTRSACRRRPDDDPRFRADDCLSPQSLSVPSRPGCRGSQPIGSPDTERNRFHPPRSGSSCFRGGQLPRVADSRPGSLPIFSNPH